MKVLSIVGARPQFIKSHAVSRQLRPDHDEVLVHTGQHYDRELSEVFFEELGLPEPDYNLGVGSDTHARQTAAMMRGLEEIVTDERPDIVLVYGDTNSTLAGALVTVKASPPLVHVEAGLRSHDFGMPEEVNRVLTDHCSDLLFTPSQQASATLQHEGITDGVYDVGDVMYDTLLYVRDQLDGIDPGGPDVPDEYALATIHRASNTDDPERLAAILDGLEQIPTPVVFPIHPRTVDALHEYGLWERAAAAEGLDIVDPVGYAAFVRLVEGAGCVVTDSGGVQKEAFYLDTPCVTVRDETEWRETVEAGWNVLVEPDAGRIVDEVRTADDLPPKPELYGNGNAAERLVTHLEDRFD